MLLPWSASKDFPLHLEYNSRSLPQSQGPASSGSCLLLGSSPPPPHFLCSLWPRWLPGCAWTSQSCFISGLSASWPGTLLSDLFTRLAPSSQSGSQLKGHLCPPPPATGGDCTSTVWEYLLPNGVLKPHTGTWCTAGNAINTGWIKNRLTVKEGCSIPRELKMRKRNCYEWARWPFGQRFTGLCTFDVGRGSSLLHWSPRGQ